MSGLTLLFSWSALCTRRRSEITEMVVPPGNYRDSDPQGSRPENARLPAAQKGAAPEAG